MERRATPARGLLRLAALAGALMAPSLVHAEVASAAVAPADRLLETALESGVRIVVAPMPAAAAGSIEIVVAVPVGWAETVAPDGAGMAAQAAAFAVHATSGTACFRAEVLPTVTLFLGRCEVADLERELTALVDRFVATESESALVEAALAATVPPPPDALARFREAAAPQSAEGRGPLPTGRSSASRSADDAAKARLLAYLAARYGSEGCVVALAGGADPALLALAAGRAFARLGRARGVAPAWQDELPAVAVRRVVAPAGSTEGCVGYRLGWSDDPFGDRLALAATFLAVAAGRAPDPVEVDRLGGIVAFRGADAAECGRQLAAAVEQLHRSGLAEPQFDALLGELDAAQRRVEQDGALRARQLALAGALHGRSDAAAGTSERWRQAGRAAAEAALRQLLSPGARVEVVPAEPSGS